MRSYGQYCALAKALDVVGERWTLLIVRELLARPCRYSDLQDGLPGIAPNLLVARLRHLEEAGVAVRDNQGRYLLTAWGERLAEPVLALARWAAPLTTGMTDTESFRGHWLALPVAFIFGGTDPRRPPFTAEIRTGGTVVTMESADGQVRLRMGPAAAPDLVMSGHPDAIVGLLAGRLDEDTAARVGVKTLGDLQPLAQLRGPDWGIGPETCKIQPHKNP